MTDLCSATAAVNEFKYVWTAVKIIGAETRKKTVRCHLPQSPKYKKISLYLGAREGLWEEDGELFREERGEGEGEREADRVIVFVGITVGAWDGKRGYI